MPSKADKYRGATVEDLDPPPALSLTPLQPIHSALLTALSHDYTHLTVLGSPPDTNNDTNGASPPTTATRSLLGYLSIPRLQSLLAAGDVHEDDPVEDAMLKFRRRKAKGEIYRVITMATPLEALEEFFDGGEEAGMGGKEDFAVVTDEERKFVLGVCTREDLEEFVRRRPR